MSAIAVWFTFMPAELWAGRPLDTEDTGTISPGSVELELSGDYASSGAEHVWTAKGVVGVGLLPGLEARVESGLLMLQPEEVGARGGLGDSVVGVKYRLLDEAEALPALLGSLVLRLPTGDETRDLGAEGVDATLLGVASKAFGPVTLTWNGGYTFVTHNRDLDTWILAGAIEYRATEAWTLVGEIFSVLGATQVPDVATLRVGNVYAITDRVKLDAAIGFGLTRESPDVSATMGATIALF